MTARKKEPGISPVKARDGKVRVWRAIVDIGPSATERRQLRRTFATFDEAKAWRAEQLTGRAHGTLVAPSKVTVDELLDTWLLGARHLKPSTKFNYEGHLKIVREHLGTIEVQRLTKRHVEKMVEHMLATGGRTGKGCSAATIRLRLIILEQAIDDALKQGLVIRNVARLVAKPRQQRGEMKVWTADQLAVFLREAASDRYAALWRVAAHGLRRSETVGLRWADVDLDGATVRIEQTRVSVGGKRVTTGSPKTVSGRRVVPIDAATVAALRKFKAKQAAERLASGAEADESDLIAITELGRPLRPEVFSDRFGTIATAAGLPTIRLHDLRHTAASLLHESGEVSLRTLAAVLGHADASFTLRTYAHSSDEAITAASATLAKLFEGRETAVM